MKGHYFIMDTVTATTINNNYRTVKPGGRRQLEQTGVEGRMSRDLRESGWEGMDGLDPSG
jgi:hypothetical protein